jgi:hypothetical protein
LATPFAHELVDGRHTEEGWEFGKRGET